MFAPTARSLRRGEGYAGFYYIFPFVQVGVTDRLSLGAGSPLIFSGDARPVWFTPKLQVIARKNAQVAAGVIHITRFEDLNAGIAYGVTTFGSDISSATVGLGYAYVGENRVRRFSCSAASTGRAGESNGSQRTGSGGVAEGDSSAAACVSWASSSPPIYPLWCRWSKRQ